MMQQDLKSEVTYIDEVKNFDIVTEKMNDDFYTYPLGTNMMMWLDDDGLIGEIECIFPEQLDREVFLIKKQEILMQNGFPLINTEVPVEVSIAKVFKRKDYFTLYFSKLETYNKEIVATILTFYVNDNELVAVKAELS
ncbi:hypothetical protein [Enterococcus wangshanyuanii]|nr:hypothetical protein [Enterococcus wangshanyuanii]